MPANVRAILQIACSIALTASLPLKAAIFTVTRGDDPAPNGCIAGDCSLREALDAAMTTPGADTIMLGSGLYNVTRGELVVVGDVTIQGVSAAATNIAGAGAFTLLRVPTLSQLTLADATLASQNDAVLADGGTAILRNIEVPTGGVLGANDNAPPTLHVESSHIVSDFGCGGTESDGHCEAFDSELGSAAGVGENVTLDLVRVVIDGPANGAGVAFYSDAALTINDSVIQGQSNPLTLFSLAQSPADVRINRTRFIGNTGPLVSNRAGTTYLEDVEFRDNIVDSAHASLPAVIDAASGTAWRISRALFVGNRGGNAEGAAVRVKGGANVVMSNVTFDNNTFKTGINGHGNTIGVDVTNNASTIFWLFQATLRSATSLPANTPGSVLSVIGSTANVRLYNSLVYGTCSFGSGAALFLAEGDIESTGHSCGLSATTNNVDVPVIQLRIGSLGDHGGFTQTYLPASGSVLLDNATPFWCRLNALDQRRFLRPSDGVNCDVGAVEANAVPDTIFSSGME